MSPETKVVKGGFRATFALIISIVAWPLFLLLLLFREKVGKQRLTLESESCR
jgi:hypothetical protein